MAIKFNVLNRFTGAVQFAAKIDCDESTARSIKLGLAVKWGIKNNANLTDANLTDADLTDANLAYADLTRADLTRADLTDADLTDANLTDADLTDADLTDANLAYANLTRANLTRADLTDANLTRANLTRADLTDANLTELGIPTITNIHGVIYEACKKVNALNMSKWHTCKSTHCRAGWTTCLAGYEGGILEGKIGTAAAATLIYRKSDPDGKFTLNFTDSNKGALAEMKRLAELEASE